MTTTEQYTIHEVIQMIERDQLRLPIFQRYFVWSNNQIADLFFTLFTDNTFGAISTIKTTTNYEIFKSRSFIDDIKDKYHLSEYNYTPNYTKDNPLFLVLDGQQRLQSFYLTFKGFFDNEEVFFNTEDCSVNFFTQNPNSEIWIPIKKLYRQLDLNPSSYTSAAKHFGKPGNACIFKFYYHVFFKRNIVLLTSKPNHHLFEDQKRFLELFIMLNTTGKQLSKGEIYTCVAKGLGTDTEVFFSKLTKFTDKINILTESESKLREKQRYTLFATCIYHKSDVMADMFYILYYCLIEEGEVSKLIDIQRIKGFYSIEHITKIVKFILKKMKIENLDMLYNFIVLCTKIQYIISIDILQHADIITFLFRKYKEANSAPNMLECIIEWMSIKLERYCYDNNSLKQIVLYYLGFATVYDAKDMYCPLIVKRIPNSNIFLLDMYATGNTTDDNSCYFQITDKLEIEDKTANSWLGEKKFEINIEEIKLYDNSKDLDKNNATYFNKLAKVWQQKGTEWDNLLNEQNI